MWRWRRVAVARVFALVVRCGIRQLLLYSRVGKNRDTKRESPAGAGAGRTADHLAFLFSQKVLAVRKANDIYRPVVCRILFISQFHLDNFRSTEKSQRRRNSTNARCNICLHVLVLFISKHSVGHIFC